MKIFVVGIKIKNENECVAPILRSTEVTDTVTTRVIQKAFRYGLQFEKKNNVNALLILDMSKFIKVIVFLVLIGSRNPHC